MKVYRINRAANSTSIPSMLVRGRYYGFFQRHPGLPFILPAMIILLGVIIYPIFYATFIGFFEKLLTKRGTTFVGFKNFYFVLTDPVFQRSAVNTVIFMVVSIPLSFGVGFSLALLMRRITWGRRFFRVALIAPMAMAPLVVGLTWRWMYNPLFGLINWVFSRVGLPQQAWLAQAHTAMAAVIFVDIWEWAPLVFLIIYAGLSGLPHEPYEAAALDGASAWMTFRYVTLPMLKPVILVALLLRSVDAFRTFDIAWVLTEGGPGYATELLSLYIYRTAFYFGNLGRAAAASLIMLIGMSTIALVYFRFLYQEVD